MLRLQKIAVTVDEARPSAFLLEEAPHSVHAAALDRAFDHKAFTLEEVAISVEFKLGIGRVAKFYRTGFFRNSFGGGKLRSARLFHEPLKLGHCEQHIFVMLGGVFDRIFGDIRSGESEVFDAVSFVIRDVEVFVLAVVYRICVAADAEIKSVGALSDDNDAFVSDRAENISVVLEVGHVDPVRGVVSDREIYVIGQFLPEAIGEKLRAVLGIRGGNGDLRRICSGTPACARCKKHHGHARGGENKR